MREDAAQRHQGTRHSQTHVRSALFMSRQGARSKHSDGASSLMTPAKSPYTVPRGSWYERARPTGRRPRTTPSSVLVFVHACRTFAHTRTHIHISIICRVSRSTIHNSIVNRHKTIRIDIIIENVIIPKSRKHMLYISNKYIYMYNGINITSTARFKGNGKAQSYNINETVSRYVYSCTTIQYTT